MSSGRSPFVEFVCREFDKGILPVEIHQAAELKFKTKIEMYKVQMAIKNFESGVYKLPETNAELESSLNGE